MIAYLQETVPDVEKPEPALQDDVPVGHRHLQIETLLTFGWEEKRTLELRSFELTQILRHVK